MRDPIEPGQLEHACRRLPIFPLPKLVLMPGTLLPLHVFEPRYRALVQELLAGPPFLGIATLRPGYESTYEGAPPIWPEIGVGRMVAHRPFADGRSNVVIEAIGAGVVTEEIGTDEPFRRVRLALVPEPQVEGSPAVRRLRTLVLQVAAGVSGADDVLGHLVDLDDTRFLDDIARKLVEDEALRRAYLRTPDLAGRVRMVEERLAEMIAVEGGGEA